MPAPTRHETLEKLCECVEKINNTDYGGNMSEEITLTPPFPRRPGKCVLCDQPAVGFVDLNVAYVIRGSKHEERATHGQSLRLCPKCLTKLRRYLGKVFDAIPMETIGGDK
jgi:hypothetical protein